MLRKQEISVNYKPFKDAAFLIMTENLANSIEASTYYPAPVPSVENFRTLIAKYQEALVLLSTRVVGAAEVRDRARQELEAGTVAWSDYATATTPDRPDLWGIAGFPLTKAHSSPRPPSPVGGDLTLSDGPEKASIHATQALVAGTIVYAWRVWPEGTEPGLFGYHTLLSKEPRVDILDLTSKETYCVQGAPWNNTGDPKWSATATRTVQ